ncbi:hypothetical protein AgCh_033564 [Apium graveolens]
MGLPQNGLKEKAGRPSSMGLGRADSQMDFQYGSRGSLVTLKEAESTGLLSKTNNINHWGHEHQLVLRNKNAKTLTPDLNQKLEESELLICDGCTKPIFLVDEIFCECNSCNFFIHGSCSQFPEKMELHLAGNLDEILLAREVFDEMSKRSDCFEIRHYYDVLDLIKISTTKLDIVAALAVHSLALKAGVLAHLPSSTSLLIKYSRAGYVAYSMTLFDDIVYKDVVVWNAMLTASIENYCYVYSVKLFLQMIKGHEFDSATLVIVVSVISRSNKLSQGREVHGLSLKAGMMLDTFYCNALINMYAKCGDLRSSESLFKILECRDTVSWNSMICGCLYNDEPVKSLLYFTEMSCTGVLADNVSLSSAVAACTHLGEWDAGQVFHGLGVKLGFDGTTHISVSNALIPFYSGCGEINVAHDVFKRLIFKDVVTWNAMIDGFASNGLIIEAFNYLSEMQLTGHVEPDTVTNKYAKEALALFRSLDFEPYEITIATILSVCTQLGLAGYGKQIHGYVFRFQFHTNSYVIAALVDSYSNSGRLERAATVFRHSSDKSVATWNSMMSAYGFHSKGQDAIKLFGEMDLSGTQPNKSTFISLLSACSHVGLVDEGIYYYGCMAVKYGVQPVIEHHVCLVDLLGKCGRLHDAYEFIKQIPCEREPGLWGALLSACNYHGDVEMGKKVADILFQLDPGNAGYYISLSNMYVASGRWSDAVEFRSLIHDKRLKKPAGYSLVDVGLE